MAGMPMTSIIADDDRRERRRLQRPAPPGLEPLHPAEHREGDRRGRQRDQGRGDRQRHQRVVPEGVAELRQHVDVLPLPRAHGLEFGGARPPTSV